MDLSTFDEWESEVRGYIRAFPVMFDTSRGSVIRDVDGGEYLDFFSGAGTLNYGHNNPLIKQAILDYIERDGILHGLDMATSAKQAFIEAFRDLILLPRGLRYRLQFTGPTGANGMEAAIKLARIATGRTNVIAFTHAYHGLSIGALAATANQHYREASGVPLTNVTFAAYDDYYGPTVDTLAMLRKQIEDPSSGVDLPAAIVLEAIQGEGGVNAASPEWLRGVAAIAAEHGIPLIVDDIQAGCGRSGQFFSFEESGIRPDMVVLSKSLSGYGLPMSLVLIAPELDVWRPGQHTGTFRGNNLAFVGGAAALTTYWSDREFEASLARKTVVIRDALQAIADEHPGQFELRGRGMFQAIAHVTDRGLAARVSREAFARGLIVETAGAYDEAVKLLPALTMDEEMLARGLSIIAESVRAALVRV